MIRKKVETPRHLRDYKIKILRAPVQCGPKIGSSLLRFLSERTQTLLQQSLHNSSKPFEHLRLTFWLEDPGSSGPWICELLSPDKVLQQVLKKESINPTYAASVKADLNPITPNLVLMGQLDAWLSQAVYADTNLIGQRGWKHSQIPAHLPNALIQIIWKKKQYSTTLRSTAVEKSFNNANNNDNSYNNIN